MEVLLGFGWMPVPVPGSVQCDSRPDLERESKSGEGLAFQANFKLQASSIKFSDLSVQAIELSLALKRVEALRRSREVCNASQYNLTEYKPNHLDCRPHGRLQHQHQHQRSMTNLHNQHTLRTTKLLKTLDISSVGIH
jgi:hypothetical protein